MLDIGLLTDKRFRFSRRMTRRCKFRKLAVAAITFSVFTAVCTLHLLLFRTIREQSGSLELYYSYAITLRVSLLLLLTSNDNVTEGKNLFVVTECIQSTNEAVEALGKSI